MGGEEDLPVPPSSDRPIRSPPLFPPRYPVMKSDRMQTRRYEIKYQTDEATVQAIRRVLRTRLEPDEFGADADRPSYFVHSLYLDSPGYDLCRATFHGERNRFKLRVRYYRDDPDEPVYLEIKRREDRCIRKQRALVRREVFPRLLAGEPPVLGHLVRPSARAMEDLETFCRLATRLRVRPSAHVAYEREAWLTAGHNSVRVTFDRAVRCEPVDQPGLTTAFARPTTVFPGRVVLEIKFTDRFPDWLRDLVRRYSLIPCSAAKYADGLACSGAVSAPPTPSAGRRRRGLRDFAGFIGDKV